MSWSNRAYIVGFSVAMASFACNKSNSKDNTNGNSNGNSTSTGSQPGSLSLGGSISGFNLTAANAPDKVIGFPLSNGAAETGGMGALKSENIGADGSFNMELTNLASDYVLVVMNSKVEEGDQFVNFIGLPTGGGSNLLNLPMDDANGELDLGSVTLDPDSTDAKSEKTAADGADALGITADLATQFADTGSVLRVIKNFVNNCEQKENGKCVNAQTTFTWEGLAKDATNKFNEPADWSYYGYSFILGFQNMTYDFDDVCQSGNPILLSFFPPEDIVGSTYGSENTFTVTPASGVTNQGLTVPAANSWGKQCGPAEGISSTAYIGDNGAKNFNFIPFSGASFTSAIPQGDWTLTAAGTGIAESYKFDLASASPIDEEGVARVWTPAIKITTDETTGIVTKVEAKFYTYNKTTGWTETTDTKALLAAIGGPGEDGNSSGGGINFLFDDNGSGTRVSESVRLKPVSGTNVFAATSFTKEWHGPLASGATRSATGNYASYRLDYILRGTQINFGLSKFE